MDCFASLAMTERFPCSRSTSRRARVRWPCISRCMRSACPSRAGRCRSSRTRCARPDYLTINPEGKVPTLVIDGRPLTEVAAILFYLAKRFPDAELLPRDDIEADAQALSWMSFIASTLHPARAARAGICHRQSTASPTGVSATAGRSAPIRSPTSICSGCIGGSPTAQARAGNVSQPHRALCAHDGPAGGATNIEVEPRSGMNCRRGAVSSEERHLPREGWSVHIVRTPAKVARLAQAEIPFKTLYAVQLTRGIAFNGETHRQSREPRMTATDIPEGFERQSRRSPLTDPWEPIYSKQTPDAIILGFGWPRRTPMRAGSPMAG